MSAVEQRDLDRLDRLDVLLGCAERGVLLVDEAHALRSLVYQLVDRVNETHRSYLHARAGETRWWGRWVDTSRRSRLRLRALRRALDRAHRARAVEAALAERLDVAEQLADALTDHALADDAWLLADTIRRLCAGDITPHRALADTTD
ncbi:hypothetical protein [Embleya sp. MST-111070]|uniref:hypothetical protein n=1 Tax=Embleya sp. MST-111070 TaxID=3398231 RepID=UPI003F733E3B